MPCDSLQGWGNRSFSLSDPQFHAGERNLLGNFRRRDYLLGKRHAVVRQKRDRQPSAGLGIGIHHLGDTVDEADDEFGHVIAGRRLRREDEAARHRVVRRIVQQAVVEDDLLIRSLGTG